MGLFGSGGGSLGLGGTKYDPTTYDGTLADITGGLQDTYEGGVDSAAAAAAIIKEKTDKAWTGMQNMASDWWDKGAEGLTDLWAGTGMEDMAARWTDPEAMKAAWMPGKWAADSPFQSKWMMGFDMLKHMEGFSMGDFQQYRQNLYSEYDKWKAGYDTTVGDLSDAAGDAEDKINENIADINEDIETGIDENTDTLNQMEDTINSNVADANVALDNLNAVVNDTSTIINQGLDASININNPNALITNPQGWYDANIEGLRQGPGKVWYDWATGKDEDAIIEQGATNIGNLFQDYGEDLGNMFGGLIDHAFDWSDDGASDELRNRRRPTNAGDPFGLEGTSRRLVESQDTFQSRQNRKAQMAPSMINKGNYA